jgi:hypothetical protein
VQEKETSLPLFSFLDKATGVLKIFQADYIPPGTVRELEIPQRLEQVTHFKIDDAEVEICERSSSGRGRLKRSNCTFDVPLLGEFGPLLQLWNRRMRLQNIPTMRLSF